MTTKVEDMEDEDYGEQITKGDVWMISLFVVAVVMLVAVSAIYLYWDQIMEKITLDMLEQMVKPRPAAG